MTMGDQVTVKDVYRELTEADEFDPPELPALRREQELRLSAVVALWEQVSDLLPDAPDALATLMSSLAGFILWGASYNSRLTEEK